jgi:hypothetical protein
MLGINNMQFAEEPSRPLRPGDSEHGGKEADAPSRPEAELSPCDMSTTLISLAIIQAFHMRKPASGGADVTFLPQSGIKIQHG